MRFRIFAAAMLFASAAALSACSSIEQAFQGSTSPSANQASALDAGFNSFTALAQLGVVYAKSGFETPAQASYIDQARSAVWQNLQAANAANADGNSALCASLIDAANQGMKALTTYLVSKGAQAPPKTSGLYGPSAGAKLMLAEWKGAGS